jgi:DNA-3-methyladenine glycosylase II
MKNDNFTKKELFLISQDKKLAKIIENNGSISFSRKKQDPFNNLVEIIISQFISTKAAEGIKKKILKSFNKEKSIKEVTNYFLQQNSEDRIFNLSQKQREVELLNLFGIGRWSIEMFEMFAMRNVNVFSSGDAALRSVMIEKKMVPVNSKLDNFEIYAERWSPFKTIASLHLWKTFD